VIVDKFAVHAMLFAQRGGGHKQGRR